MRKYLLLSILFIPMVSIAGYDQGGGSSNIIYPFTPDEDYSYDCEAKLHTFGPRAVDQEARDVKEIISVQNFIFDNKNTPFGDSYKFKSEDWKHYEFTVATSDNPVEIDASKVPYGLDRHFSSMSFSIDEVGNIGVSLRAVINLGKSLDSGDSTAGADYSSSNIYVMSGALLNGSSVSLTVSCKKTK